MADFDLGDLESGFAQGRPPRGQRLERALHLAGAASSALLLVGALWWGYQLAVRDVTGVPVMRAVAGAMRVAPSDPGGDVAGHQGLSVNAVAAAGTAAPLPDQLFLAPAPASLAAEDLAGLAQPLTAAAPAPATEPAPEATPVAALPAAEIPGADPASVAAALSEALATPGDLAEASTEVTLVSSLRPQRRPASAPATPASLSKDAAPAAGLDPAAIALGTQMVQVGAYDDENAAKSDWTRLSGRFPELMEGKAMLVQPAQSGGRTFYRLRAVGFDGEDAARRFCTALVAENATCIPVTQR